MSPEVQSVWGVRPGHESRSSTPASPSSVNLDSQDHPHEPRVDPYRGERPRDELDQLKGQFLASLNHEIRTPLSGLMGMADLLGETELDRDQGECLSGIRDCARQLMETLDSVLVYSSISAGQIRLEESEFHLMQVLESVAAVGLAKAESKGLRLLFQVEDGLPETAIGDERHLSHALTHLMRNAVKFTEHGEVELRAGCSPLPGSRMMLNVTLRDTGIGIPADKLHLLFESFRQLESGLARRHAGLGLGLALVDRLARIMRGTVEVHSEPMVGSAFTLHVPLRLPSGSLQLAAPPAAAAQGRRILVVDDNRIAQDVVTHILGRAGFDVEVVSGGEEALRMADATRYDLVLMDLQMPGMDGLTAARAMRALPGYEQVPILALTANYSDEHRVLCEQVGMQGFLSKPFQKEDLVRSIRGHLGHLV